MNKPPLLYYRTMEQIEEYRKKPVLQKNQVAGGADEFFPFCNVQESKGNKG